MDKDERALLEVVGAMRLVIVALVAELSGTKRAALADLIDKQLIMIESVGGLPAEAAMAPYRQEADDIISRAAELAAGEG